ncbi:MAG TPA: hypothetical protein VHU80_20625 [Polyangiaceae bacterium]|jgi:hypothetical protein|nr:hypothetical protein [Polyangiaceae bacterium]
MARLSRLPIVVLVAAGLGACNNSTATLVGVTPSTAIAVDPLEFLGNVKCGTDPGEMQLYVATLKDVSPQLILHIPEDAKLVLPSSNPTGCGISVLFENIVDGRQYTASVDGYDRGNIEPLAPGSRTMVDVDTRAYVTPRWTTNCAHDWYPPSLRSSDGGLKRDAGHVEHADSGFQPDGGYYECRPVVLYGPNKTPWLGGPVCGSTEQTVTVHGCDPLQ